MSNLKPAVNRQPKFPRGWPEELANVHDVRANSYMSAPHLRIHNAISLGQHSNQFLQRQYIFADVRLGA